MAIEKGRDITAIAADVSVDLSDPNQRRWTSPVIINFMNQAIRELARNKAFSREDIQVPTAQQNFFETFAEMIAIDKVEYNNKPLDVRSLGRMERDFGQTWRTTEEGDPRSYIPTRLGIELWPVPVNAGTALNYTGSPDITEAQGGKINGDNYTGGDNAGTIAHWLTGDGEVTNEFAENNLRIKYHFVPRASAAGDSIPGRYEDALRAHAMWKCVAISDAPEEKVIAQTYYADWLKEKSEVIGLAHDDAAANGLLAGKMQAR